MSAGINVASGPEIGAGVASADTDAEAEVGKSRACSEAEPAMPDRAAVDSAKAAGPEVGTGATGVGTTVGTGARRLGAGPGPEPVTP